ncbi:MAG: murein transglycosylase, partial [Paracoccaceae bacterium]
MFRRILAGLIVTVIACSSAAGPRYGTLRFDDLLGWDKDEQSLALDAFLLSCRDIRAKEWKPICAYGTTVRDARQFFETFFTPVILEPQEGALFTGYFEP